MLQASFLDCLFLDFLSQFQDFCASAVIHIERRQIVQALVVTMVVVVIDEGFDLPLGHRPKCCILCVAEILAARLVC